MKTIIPEANNPSNGQVILIDSSGSLKAMTWNSGYIVWKKYGILRMDCGCRWRKLVGRIDCFWDNYLIFFCVRKFVFFADHFLKILTYVFADNVVVFASHADRKRCFWCSLEASKVGKPIFCNGGLYLAPRDFWIPDSHLITKPWKTPLPTITKEYCQWCWSPSFLPRCQLPCAPQPLNLKFGSSTHFFVSSILGGKFFVSLLGSYSLSPSPLSNVTTMLHW